MNKQIIQIENTNANDFKNEIVKDVTNALKEIAGTMQNSDSNAILTRHETASMLNISLVTLWQWTKNNTLPAYKIGGKVRYKKSEILESLQKMNKFST